jgi:hypothetical protein
MSYRTLNGCAMFHIAKRTNEIPSSLRNLLNFGNWFHCTHTSNTNLFINIVNFLSKYKRPIVLLPQEPKEHMKRVPIGLEYW